jgi:hypothetical protein
MKEIIEKSIKMVERWVENHNYKAYEPFDGLSSPFRFFTFGSLFLDRLLMQLIRQSPINLRPFFGIKPLESTKGRGYMAWGYLLMFDLKREEEYQKKAINCLEWLMANKSPKFQEYSWGNHFDFASRGGRYSKQESIIVWTALIGQAFLDGYVILKDKRFLNVAESICKWIINLPREQTSQGTCISYFYSNQSSIHNANMLGAAMLARTFKFTGNEEYIKVAKEAMEYSCSRQRHDGSWWYAEDSRYHWVDNFHTGYNLDSLKCYINNTNDHSFDYNLMKGLEFFKKNFFDNDGTPKYYHNRTYPIDIQCASQAIDTLANFADSDKISLELGLKVASWTIKNMQDKSGYFYYRKYPLLIAKAPMLHWGQATMYKALVNLLSKLINKKI